MARQFYVAADVITNSNTDPAAVVYAHNSLNRHALELIFKAIMVRAGGWGTIGEADAELKKIGHGWSNLIAKVCSDPFFAKSPYFMGLIDVAESYAAETAGAGLRYPYASQTVTIYSPDDVTKGIGFALNELSNEAATALQMAGLDGDQIKMALYQPQKA